MERDLGDPHDHCQVTSHDLLVVNLKVVHDHRGHMVTRSFAL